MDLRLARSVALVACAAMWLGIACSDATDVELLEVPGTGVVRGSAFLDLNGSGVLDAGDTPLRNARLALVFPTTGESLYETTTDSLGAFVLLGVTVGSYQLSVDTATLSDSLNAIGAGDVTVDAGDTLQVTVGATYPTLSLTEVRGATTGRRVFTTGYALNQRLSFGDGVVHLQDGPTYLRTTNVAPTGVATGDSVRFLGTTATSNGQPILDQVTPLVLRPLAGVPLPVALSTGAAATAGGGPYDAALVRINLAEISDTSTAPNGDFHFWADDGSDSVEVVFRWFLQIPTANVRPDTVVRIAQATGLLTPFDDGTGAVRWRLLPRASGEVSYQTKQADVALGVTFDTAQASVGDTVEIRVTARNLGPQTATGVQVADTIPAAFTLLPPSTATRGSYDAASRIWTVGDLPAGAAADTLRLRVEVTGGSGTVTNTARLLPLTREVEVNPLNNVAAQSLTIS